MIHSGGLAVFSRFRSLCDIHTRSIKLICTIIHTQHDDFVSALFFSQFLCIF